MDDSRVVGVATCKSGESADELDENDDKCKDKEDVWLPPPLWPVLVVQFMYVFGIFMVVPAYPFIWATTPMADGDPVVGSSLHASGEFLNATAEFLSASLLGVLSDRFGRKPFLILASSGQVIDFLMAGLSAQDREYAIAFQRGSTVMMCARAAAGFMGNAFIFARSYIGDISTKDTRAKNFSMMAACVGVAALIAPFLGGVMAKHSLRTPMLFAASANLFAVIFTTFFVRESLPPSLRTKCDMWRANPIGILLFLLSNRFLIVFACMAFLDQFALSIVRVHLVSYVSVIYKVGKQAIVLLIMTFGACQVTALLFLLRLIVKHCGELTAMKFGYGLTCIAFAGLALASYARSFSANVIMSGVLGIGAIANPAQLAVAVACVQPTEQGKMQAALGSLDVLGKMAATGMVALIWGRAVSGGYPEIVWWLASFIMLPGVVIAFILHRCLPERYCDGNETSEESSEDIETSDEGSTL